MRWGWLLVFLLLLLPAFAADEIVLGSVGTFTMGEAVSGGGKYFIGIGKVVDANAGIVVVGIGEVVNVSGNVGDVYVLGKSITIEGNAKNVYGMGGTLTIAGNVEGNVLFYGDKITVKSGAKVGHLEGKVEEKVIAGAVVEDAMEVKKEEKPEDVWGVVWDYVTTLIAALIFFVILQWLGIAWDERDLGNVLTYIYGLLITVLPAILLVTFIVSLITLPVPAIFLALFGLHLGVLGFWVTALMFFGIPVFHIIGRRLVNNDHLAVFLGYTAVFILGKLAPIVWFIVNVVGAGLLLWACKRRIVS